jgi:hypothetical protein
MDSKGASGTALQARHTHGGSRFNRQYARHRRDAPTPSDNGAVACALNSFFEDAPVCRSPVRVFFVAVRRALRTNIGMYSRLLPAGLRARCDDGFSGSNIRRVRQARFQGDTCGQTRALAEAALFAAGPLHRINAGALTMPSA